MTNTKKFVFIHIPKTAGSMFRTLVNKNFGDDSREDNPLYSELKYTQEQVEKIFYLYPFRFISGHVFSIENSVKACNGTLQLISFTRNPYEKIWSSYNYLRNRKITNDSHLCKKKSFNEMIEYVLDLNEFSSLDLDSCQLDWLVGSKNSAIEKVDEVLKDQRLMLFPMERFDEACVCLEKIFPNDFTDCCYSRKINTSGKMFPIELTNLISKLPYIKRDIILHERANSFLDLIIEKHFDSNREFQDELNNFKNKCISSQTRGNRNLSKKWSWRRIINKLK